MLSLISKFSKYIITPCINQKLHSNWLISTFGLQILRHYYVTITHTVRSNFYSRSLSPTHFANSRQRTIADQKRIVFAISDISSTRRWSLFILAFETASGWRFAKFPPPLPPPHSYLCFPFSPPPIPLLCPRASLFSKRIYRRPGPDALSNDLYRCFAKFVEPPLASGVANVAEGKRITRLAASGPKRYQDGVLSRLI